MKTFLKVLRILGWIAFTALIALLYAAFYTGFFTAVKENDYLNYLTMPSFIGAFALVHYLVLLLINKIGFKDEFFAFKLLPVLKEQGALKGILITVGLIIVGVVTAVPVILVHLYYTLVMFGILSPKVKKYTYTPSTTYNKTTTGGSTAKTTTNNTTNTQKKVSYDFDSYKNHVRSGLTNSSIYVNPGYSKFVKSAKVTSLSVTFSQGDTPSVTANAEVTVYIDQYQVKSYIGVDSHHNSTYANSNVVDSEISDAISNAKDSAKREIEAKIRSLTNSFASQNSGAPTSVNESVNVTHRKA